MKTLLLMTMLLAWTGSLQAQDLPASAGSPASPTDAGAILARARIPSDDNPHGETRLIQRQGGACVQTLLHTTALRRGVHEMLKKEQAAWPAGQEGHSDSAAYREALEAAKQHVLSSVVTNTPAGGRLSLLMEMTLSPLATGYAFYDVKVEWSEGEYVVSDKTLIASRDAPARYASRAMRLMAANAFRLPENELTDLLHQAGWWAIPPAAAGGAAALEKTP